MARQVRHRVTAVLLGGVLLATLLLTNGLANAGEPGPPAGPRGHPAQVTATSPPVSTPTSRQGIARQSIPDSGVSPRTKIKRATKTRRGTGSSAQMPAGKPPGSKKAGVRRVPAADLPSPTASAPAAPALPDSDIAADPVTTTDPIRQNGLIGLLAAVAIVLVLGVSIGVIRAIVSERASRTKIA